MSLLLDHHHPHARHYPLGMLMDEAQLVDERFNRRQANMALLLQLGASAMFSKKAAKTFKREIEKMIGE